MNAINLIIPYRYEGMWVFDDPRVGLDKEPFVSGTDTMIDVLVQNIPDAQTGFRLLFSASPFPGYQFNLNWRREEFGGNWYHQPIFKWKAGSAPLCSNISNKRRKKFISKRSRDQTKARSLGERRLAKPFPL